MFATLLATPCSAPFLGTAVAFSLAASALQLFIIFSALGIGMALPWLLIALFPAIALCLPRPGKWMNSIRTFFALLILITCFWLLSLLTTFIGLNMTLLIAFLLTALQLFLIAKKRGSRAVIVVLSAILMSSAGWAMLSNFSTKQWAGEHTQLQWQPLQRTVIDRQVEQGNIVFVDITADWCITCKANKIGVLLQEPVYTRLQEKDIIVMRGDWTIPSESISEYLQSYGRFGVPFNIVYGPDAPQGIPLATLLTTESVLAAIGQAKEVRE
jgi:suppressor for copper-sensitivity B